MAALLSDLEVSRSHSRARVSDDNPYSKALFMTLKYGPEFPERFTTTTDPQIIALPGPAWINQPRETTEQ